VSLFGDLRKIIFFIVIERVVEIGASSELTGSSFVRCRRHQTRGLTGPIHS